MVEVGTGGKAREVRRDMITGYQIMLIQIALDYSSLPDVRTLNASEIRFFYNGLRASMLSQPHA